MPAAARDRGSKLELRWPPRQIAAWLGTSYPNDPEMRVPTRPAACRCSCRPRGRSQGAGPLSARRPGPAPAARAAVMNGQGQLRGAAHISERPAEASDRAVPGHGEGDLPSGKGSSAAATPAGRKSRFAGLAGLPGGPTAGAAADAPADALTGLPAQLRRSITWDQGEEMAGHARFSVAAGVPVYFWPAEPLAARHQREHQRAAPPVLPRSTDFRALSQQALGAVAAELNDRPRQTLRWKSPCQALDEALR